MFSQLLEQRRAVCYSGLETLGKSGRDNIYDSWLVTDDLLLTFHLSWSGPITCASNMSAESQASAAPATADNSSHHVTDKIPASLKHESTIERLVSQKVHSLGSIHVQSNACYSRYCTTVSSMCRSSRPNVTFLLVAMWTPSARTHKSVV